MKRTIYCLGLLLLLSPTAGIAEDNVIKNARLDIARFEKQANGLTPARASHARRILKLLTLSHARLKQSTHQDEADWQAVDRRYQSLKAQLEGIIAGQQGTVKNEVATQTKAETTSAKPGAKQTKSTAALVSGQRVRVKKLARDINSVSDSIVTNGPSLLQDRNKVLAYQKRMKQFATALGRYPQLEDPDVKQARAAYLKLKNKLSEEFERAKGQLARLGNVQQRLAVIEANSRKYAVPSRLTIPFDQNQAQAWVKAASSARTVAEHNLKELSAIAPLAYLPNNPGTPQTGAPYDANDIKRLTRFSQSNLKKVQASYRALSNELSQRLNHVVSELSRRYQVAPDSDKRWVYLGKGRKDEALAEFGKGKQVALSSIYLETALGRQPQQAQQALDKLQHAEQGFMKNYRIALEGSRLPDAKSTDKKLQQIARQIVEKPRYKFGQHGKVVLTTDKIIERERKNSEIHIDDAQLTLGGEIKMKGTETVWTYKWKEFRFAVPIKEADSNDWYIWWITAKNFSSGGPKTPLNEWVSGKATQGNRILEKNL